MRLHIQNKLKHSCKRQTPTRTSHSLQDPRIFPVHSHLQPAEPTARPPLWQAQSRVGSLTHIASACNRAPRDDKERLEGRAGGVRSWVKAKFKWQAQGPGNCTMLSPQELLVAQQASHAVLQRSVGRRGLLGPNCCVCRLTNASDLHFGESFDQLRGLTSTLAVLPRSSLRYKLSTVWGAGKTVMAGGIGGQREGLEHLKGPATGRLPAQRAFLPCAVHEPPCQPPAWACSTLK